MIKTRYPGVFEKKDGKGKKAFYTRNLAPGISVYGEKLVTWDKSEYREWIVTKSKLGAGIAKRIKKTGIKEGDYVLYLGCASGTTVSHVSDIVGKKGCVFAVDFSHRVLRDLVFVAEQRKNIVPILTDANDMDVLSKSVVLADVLFQDIAQKQQLKIFLKNLAFLKKGGYALLSLKARSVDVTEAPKKIFSDVRKELAKHIEVLDAIELAPLEMDHCLFLCRKK